LAFSTSISLDVPRRIAADDGSWINMRECLCMLRC